MTNARERGRRKRHHEHQDQGRGRRIGSGVADAWPPAAVARARAAVRRGRARWASSGSPCPRRPTRRSSRASTRPTRARASSSRPPTAPPATRAAPSRPASTPTTCTSRWRATSPAWSTPAWSPTTGTTARPRASCRRRSWCSPSAKGNPKDIQGWDDLVKPGVEIVTPNPASSGAARWNVLAAWGQVIADGGTEDDAEAYLTKFFDNVVALPGSGRDATTAFLGGTGDVLMAYENEAILARQNGEEFDYIIPDDHAAHREPGRGPRGRRPEGAGVARLRAQRGRPDAQFALRGLPARHRRASTARSRAPTTRPTRSRAATRCSPSRRTSEAGASRRTSSSTRRPASSPQIIAAVRQGE